MIPEQKIKVEQKLIIVDDDGHSIFLAGDSDKVKGGLAQEDRLPALLSKGWRIVQLVPYSGSGRIMALLQKEVNL